MRESLHGAGTGAALSSQTLADWLTESALPCWLAEGRTGNGAFVEVLGAGGDRPSVSRRARVQARQIWVYASAGLGGWPGPWTVAVERALERFRADYRRPDGRYRTLVTVTGAPLDDTVMLYDQAFVALALSGCWAANLDRKGSASEAEQILDWLIATRRPEGGWRENGPHPFQSNAHMHLLEAALAWEALDVDPRWSDVADHIVELALAHFVDSASGVLREFFDVAWRPASGSDGRLVEPGHQFEWAWLLARYASARQHEGSRQAARVLYRSGLAGVDTDRQVAMDSLDDRGGVVSASARLWPQTEWIKAAAILGDADSAVRGLRALGRYLLPDGRWLDRMEADGTVIDQPSPASTFYHIWAAHLQLAAD